MDPCGKAEGPMRIGTLVLLGGSWGVVLGNTLGAPWELALQPDPG